MTKIVINNCYGGFGLSDEAFVEYFRRKGQTIYPCRKNSLFANYYTVPLDQVPEIVRKDYFELTDAEREEYKKLKPEGIQVYQHTIRDKDRSDPDLVAVVEEMGAKASGALASLRVVDVPDGVDWEIEEYDGNEWVAEAHRTWS